MQIEMTGYVAGKNGCCASGAPREIDLSVGYAQMWGRTGEKNGSVLVYDARRWLDAQPAGRIEAAYTRPDGLCYPVVCAVEKGRARAVLTAADVEAAGKAQIEFRLMVGDELIVKSHAYCGIIEQSMGENADAPGEPGEAYLEKVYSSAERAEEAAKKAEKAAERAENAGGSGGGGGPGEPGEPGAPGAPGEDGGYYLPEVDEEGNLSFTPSKEGMPDVPEVNIRGPQGKAGPQGEPGADGKTPVAGVDFFTEADRAEMVDAVLSALPKWTGGDY